MKKLGQHLIIATIFSLSTTLPTTLWAKIFIYCSEGSPSSFNPQITTDGTSNNASTHTVYNRLVKFKYGTTEIVPSLASSWKISPDGKSYTFKLRRGVKFHTTKYFKPTREFNGQDVLFSINRQRVKKHPYHHIGGGNYEYFNGMEMGKLIKNVISVDDYTVKITLHNPESPFLANLAMGFMSILSAEYATNLQKKGEMEQIDTHPIGTGPFVFRRYVKDTLIRYRSNKSYFEGQPKLDKLIFSITPDASVRYQKLKTKECHLITEPAPADLKGMMAQSSYIKLMSAPGLNVGYLAMNVQKKPLNRRMVRQAIGHALNRESYIKAIYLGNAMVAKNPLPPTIWSYNDKIRPRSYNLQKAKELLKKAGYPNGFNISLWTLPVSRPYNPNGKKMGEMIQADLAKIGIKVKLVSYDWPTYLAKSRKGEHQMIQLGWTGDNGDPDNFLYLLGCAGVLAGSNVAKWCDKKFDRLLTKAKRLSDRKKRIPLYHQAQEIFRRESPWIPIAHSKIFRAMLTNVDGYKIDPLGGDIFTYVDLK
ncbi:MAG: ABC transporter substrate-binding protein [Bdellovibrionales bacterium]|jgi:dipeptide transport system substrate-binding protein|nr:ABC transporter substrate-binding protein [Bdellovibrionales bacterium]MBT3526951.1 ABC transporter substrate-binding protein [Bdellovibrionales bacterium]MBT7668169.1 ABC transporter substrate-binding protein [Bdellovibrionales bacterium]MBT7765934.1 ABC transporter substrate-binding protein [Bdellovibrionales bacterium]